MNAATTDMPAPNIALCITMLLHFLAVTIL